MTGSKLAQKKAKENIEKFLRELDAQIPGDSDEVYLNNHYSDIFQSVWIARMLNEYDERKQQAIRQLKDFSTQVELERVNGFKYLSRKRKREVNIKRRHQAEQIVIKARLGPEDIDKFLIPVVCKIYIRGGFDIPKRYRPYSKKGNYKN